MHGGVGPVPMIGPTCSSVATEIIEMVGVRSFHHTDNHHGFQLDIFLWLVLISVD